MLHIDHEASTFGLELILIVLFTQNESPYHRGSRLAMPMLIHSGMTFLIEKQVVLVLLHSPHA